MLENKSSNTVKHINATTIGTGYQSPSDISMSAVLYIVPKGKKFKGYIWATQRIDSESSAFTVNGQPFPLLGENDSHQSQAKIYLKEHDVIGFASTYYNQRLIVSLTGVEF